MKLVTGGCYDAVLHTPSSCSTGGEQQQRRSLGLLLSNTLLQQRGHPEDTLRGGERGGKWRRSKKEGGLREKREAERKGRGGRRERGEEEGRREERGEGEREEIGGREGGIQ